VGGNSKFLPPSFFRDKTKHSGQSQEEVFRKAARSIAFRFEPKRFQYEASRSIKNLR
jgi:hypothetical protein